MNNDDRSRIIKNNRAKEQEQPVLPEMEYVVDYQFLSLKSLMWNLPFMVRFEEGVDADRLARAVKKVFLSHPVMSTMIIFNEDGELCQKYMPNVISICHNDMDSKNVMWLNDEYKIIDLECLGYFNPYLELFELALCWSGYEKCDIDFNKFKTFMNSYFENSKLDRNINWEVLYYFNNGRLGWLEYNLKRALRIECSSEEEYEIGMNEVKETIEHVVYYDKVKNDILKNINL